MIFGREDLSAKEIAQKNIENEKIKKGKLCIDNRTNKGITFVWVEHVDPNDGIGFSHAATMPLKGTLPWSNLIEVSDKKNDVFALPLPVLKPEFINGIIVHESAELGVIEAYDISSTRSNRRGWIGYNFKDDQDVENKYQEFYTSFKIPVCNISGRPNILILSGHGVRCEVFGEQDDPNTGKINCGLLKFYSEFKILIITSCSNVSRGNVLRYLKLFENKGFAAVIGYEDTYSGGIPAGDIMFDFVKFLREGNPLIDSWKRANEKHASRGSFPWAAVFKEEFLQSSIDDIIKGEKGSTQVLYCSKSFPTPAPIPHPNTVALFANVKKEWGTSEYTLNEFQSGFSNRITEIDAGKFDLTISPGADNGNALIIRHVDTRPFEHRYPFGSTYIKPFQAGTTIYLKFCVVRPNWKNQIDLSQIVGIFRSSGGYSISFPQGGLDKSKPKGSIIRLDIHSELMTIGIPWNFIYEAKGHLSNAAVNDPSDLVIYLFEGQKIPPIAMSEDPNGARKSWWRTEPKVKDLSYYATSLETPSA